LAIGVGQQGARRGLDPQMDQLTLATSQLAVNLAQQMRPPQLVEQHRHKLASTAQPLGAMLSTRILDQFLELSTEHLYFVIKEDDILGELHIVTPIS